MGGRALDRVCGKIKYDENVFFSLPVGAVCINSAVMAFDVLNYSGHFAKPDQRHTVKWENDRNACGRIKKKKKGDHTERSQFSESFCQVMQQLFCFQCIDKMRALTFLDVSC